MEARGAGLVPTHEAVPSQHDRDAHVDQSDGKDRQVVDAKRDVDLEVLEVRGSGERDVAVQVDVARDVRRGLTGETPTHQKRRRERNRDAEQGGVRRRESRAHAGDGDHERA